MAEYPPTIQEVFAKLGCERLASGFTYALRPYQHDGAEAERVAEMSATQRVEWDEGCYSTRHKSVESEATPRGLQLVRRAHVEAWSALVAARDSPLPSAGRCIRT